MPSAVASVGDGPLKVVSATAEQMFLNIRPEQIKDLPRYEGDLLLTDHSAGSITSQSYQKRWNRMNELLADAAEKASVGAAWLGSRTYPQERLNNAWTLVMGGQFHDILPGTSTPKAFQFSWNDDVIAMNQFASVLTSATEGIAAGLNTQTVGHAIVVYNPLNIAREDVVEASVTLPGGVAKIVRVFGPDGVEVPAQIIGEKDGGTKFSFSPKCRRLVTPFTMFAQPQIRSFGRRSTSRKRHSRTTGIESISMTMATWRVFLISDSIANCSMHRCAWR